MRPDEPDVEMSEREYRLLRDLIHEHCGIFFDDDAHFVVHRRLAPRLAALGVPDFTAYHAFLRRDPRRVDELEQIVERITTNETYFFREEYQLTALRHEILPRLAELRRRERRLTLWSAGCATGEEAYTLAMLVLDSGLFGGWDVHVIGNDISRRVLQVARRGAYGRGSFRAMPGEYRRYFVDDGEGRRRVRDDVRGIVSFAQLNLMKPQQCARVGEVGAASSTSSSASSCPAASCSSGTPSRSST
jgi:chemotaxis protein methyltransferase CheR